MKTSIIRQIYKGEKGNHENIPDSQILNNHIKKFWEYEDILKKLLTDEQKAIFDLYDNEHSEIEFERETLAYTEGFKLGLLIGIECMDE